MTPQQAVALALRLFAIWLGIQVLRMVPWFFEPGAVQSSSHAYVAFLLALGALIIVVLWRFPGSIAGKLVPAGDAQPRASTSADAWLAMGCMLIGLWTLTTTLPRLAYDTFALNSMPRWEDHSQLHYWVVYNLTELLISMWLILGGRGARKLFWWMQNAGTGSSLHQ